MTSPLDRPEYPDGTTGGCSRRRFLGLAGGAAIAGVVGCRAAIDPGAVPATTELGGGPIAASATGRHRTLVVVELAGGVDVLSAIVPADGRYRDARPTLAIAEDEIVGLGHRSGAGLHPALASLLTPWQAERLALIQGIGIPGQSRSHFQALDTMWSARPGEARRSGWLGRWLDATARDDDPPLRAVALGSTAPALVGDAVLPTVVLDPDGFVLDVPEDSDRSGLLGSLIAMSEPVADDAWVALAQSSFVQTLGSVEALQDARGSAASGRPAAGRTGSGRGAATATGLLEVAAGVIELDAGTDLISVGLSGFDTHDGQANRLPRLLEDLAAGLGTFDERLQASGRAGDVVVVVQSEFGRRVAENGGGTDHGQAGLSMVIGDAVTGGQLLGEARLGDLVDGDLPIVIDTRSVYADVLDWLGGPTDDVIGSTDRLGVITG